MIIIMVVVFLVLWLSISELGGLEKLVEIAGKHTVIKLAYLISTSAIKLFKVFA